MRFVLLHYHILKNAGSTIEEILYHNFRDRLARVDKPDRDGHVSNAEIVSYLDQNPQITAFSSHQINYPVPQARGYLFFDLCFLRDPMDRIRSTYDYFRLKPSEGDPVSDMANRAGEEEFVTHLIENYPWMVNDVQVNLLANGVVNDQPQGAEDLDRATARMLETSFLGVVDCFEESIIAGQLALRIVFPNLNGAQAPVNVSGGLGGNLEARIAKFREALGERVYSELARLNQMDVELVRRARAEVRRRFERVPDHAKKLRALEHRVQMLQGEPMSRSETRPAEIEEEEITAPAPARIRERPRATPPSMFTKVQRVVQAIPHLAAMRRLFDANYYGGTLLDFVARGAFEGRKPHPLFDPAFYLRKYPDVKMNPLAHYLKYGAIEGRDPHPLFDAGFYLRRYPDVRAAQMNPLLHYIRDGASENRKPHPLFQPDYYFARCQEAWLSGINPLIYFLEHETFLENGAGSPHPLFDCEAYRETHPEEENPLVDYVLRGEPASSDSPFEIMDVPADPALPAQRPFFESVRRDQLLANGATPPSLAGFARVSEPTLDRF
ncbi:MAG TPA: hypothetical protein VK419_06520 [Bryobacteraceae bacterium]|nr:hypothetical protein [Bryobacteraceae bacterium]